MNFEFHKDHSGYFLENDKEEGMTWDKEIS